MRVCLFCLVLLVAWPSIGAGQTLSALDRALALVMAHHPELMARKDVFWSELDKPGWSADLSLSLTEDVDMRGGSGGGRAQLSITIPLVGRQSELEAAQARRELEAARGSVRNGFLDRVSELRERSLSVETARERRDFWKDQAEYNRRAVEEGLQDPGQLWSQADSLQRAEHEYRRALDLLESGLERTAREYGGDEWTNLLALLEEIVSLNQD